MASYPSTLLLENIHNEFEAEAMRAYVKNSQRFKSKSKSKPVSEWKPPQKDSDSKVIDESVRKIPGD